MRKVIDYVNEHKKIIIVILLIVLLIGAVYIIDKGEKTNSASTSVNANKSRTEVKLINILSSIEGVGSTDVMITEN